MSLPQHDGRLSQPDYLASILLFLVSLLIFWFSPVTQVSDSRYSLLLSDSLIRHRTFTLDHYALQRHAPQSGIRDDYVANGPIWQIEVVNNHLYYYFPPGSSILSIPFVAGARLLGFSVVKFDGTYNEQTEIKLQKALSAFLMALCVCVIFLTARYLLPLSWSFAIALAAAFGTQLWSTTSRALWSHTWETLLISVAIWLLVRNEFGGKPLRPVLLGTVTAWLYFVRPNASLIIAAIAIYLFVRKRHQFVLYLITAFAWIALFVFYSWRSFGTVLPSYYKPTRLRLDLFPIAFAGNLISPSRGLFIYVPLVLFVAFLVVKFWRPIQSKALATLAICVVVAHVLLVSSFANRWGDWWGGASYGPRYLSELVPFFALLAALSIAAMRKASQKSGLLTATAGVCFMALSVFINARGALSPATWKWTQPNSDEQMRALLWDWRHPQFLAGLQTPAPPIQIPLIKPGLRLELGSSDVEKYLWYGWSTPEAGFRWTDGPAATIVFRVDSITGLKLRMKVAPYTVDGQLKKQQFTVFLNDEPLETVELTAGPTREIDIRLPAAKIKSSNVLTFQFPNAASPKELGEANDNRLLALRVEWLEFSNDD